MARRSLSGRVKGCVPSSVVCGLLPVAMGIESLPSWGQKCSVAMASLGNGYSHRDISSRWGAELPLSISSVTEMYWPYLMQLWIMGWGCLFLDWKGITVYWNTSLLSCGKTDLSDVLCSFCLAGMLSPHLLPQAARVPYRTLLARSVKSCI